MEQYVILRRGGWGSPAQLGRAGARSKQVVDEEMSDEVQWVRSYVLDEGGASVGMVCIYEATGPEAIRRHAARAGMPIDEIIRVVDTVVMALLLDLVPCHTSIEHPWFRGHPERYVWADGLENNWRAAFGGPAWSQDGRTGRWYLHSFFPEQPDLDWRRPDVVEAMQEVVRFWLGHGADGFRVDAIDRVAKHPDLLDDPPRAEPFPFPEPPDVAALDRRNSSHWIPGLAGALGALRSAAGGAFLVGEVYRPTVELGPYLEHLDTAFVFELM